MKKEQENRLELSETGEVRKCVLKIISAFGKLLTVAAVTAGAYIIASQLGESERGYKAFGGGELAALSAPLFFAFKRLWSMGNGRR